MLQEGYSVDLLVRHILVKHREGPPLRKEVYITTMSQPSLTTSKGCANLWRLSCMCFENLHMIDSNLYNITTITCNIHTIQIQAGK